MGSVNILKASAGSGKTYRLAYEYIKGVVSNPALYRRTLAVTFTNKATEQMKSAIIRGLGELASPEFAEAAYMAQLTADLGLPPAEVSRKSAEALGRILHDYSRFGVSTIDKFFQRVIRAFFRELDFDIGYTVELEGEGVLREAVERILERSLDEPWLSDVIEHILQQQGDDEGGWDLRPGITRIAKEVFKESYRRNPLPAAELSGRFAELKLQTDKQGEGVRRMAKEILEAIAAEGLALTDFKGGSTSFALNFRKLADGTAAKLSETFRTAAADPAQWHTKGKPRSRDIETIAPRLQEMTARLLKAFDAWMPAHNTLEAAGENLYYSQLLSEISGEVRAASARRGQVMIHQTNELIASLVTSNDAPFIYEKLGTTYSRYMIDEFQDTSRRQWLNFLPLLDETLASADDASGTTPVMLIGDVKQSIYRWRGGDWRILGGGAEVSFAGRLAPPELMNTNWRSERHIVEFNNLLLRNVVAADDTAIKNELEGSSPELRKELDEILRESYKGFEQQPSPRRAAGEGFVTVTRCPTEATEPLLLDRIADLLERGYRLRDIAVLVRSNREGAQAAATLIAAGYDIVSQEALLLDSSPVVRFVMATLALAANPQDGVALAQHNRFLGRDFDDPADRPTLRRLLEGSVPEMFEFLIETYELGGPRHRGDIPFLQALYQSALTLARQHVVDVPLLLKWWDDRREKESIYLPSKQDAITIITIHKAKGLEYPCVLIPQCDWQVPPKWNSILWAEATPGSGFDALGVLPLYCKSALAGSFFSDAYRREVVYSHVDNINTLYVALTRAGRELHVIYSKVARNLISRYVDHALQQLAQGPEGVMQTETGETVTYSYGVPLPRPATVDTADDTWLLEELPSRDTSPALRLRWASERYFTEDGLPGASGKFGPRRRGIALHRLFSLIDTSDDIAAAIGRMRLDGSLAAAECDETERYAREAIGHPVASAWFAPGAGWQVRNENDIITREGVRRPDRVMTAGNRAIVIDYKFGENEKPAYLQQIRDYLSLLARMGYTETEGYLWYVESGRIVKV